jgi:hypothetical protein
LTHNKPYILLELPNSIHIVYRVVGIDKKNKD